MNVSSTNVYITDIWQCCLELAKWIIYIRGAQPAARIRPANVFYPALAAISKAQETSRERRRFYHRIETSLNH